MKKHALRASKKSKDESKGSFTEIQPYSWIFLCGFVYTAGAHGLPLEG